MSYVWSDKKYKLPKSKSFFDKVVTYDKRQTVYPHKGNKVTSFRFLGFVVWQRVETHFFN